MAGGPRSEPRPRADAWIPATDRALRPDPRAAPALRSHRPRALHEGLRVRGARRHRRRARALPAHPARFSSEPLRARRALRARRVSVRRGQLAGRAHRVRAGDAAPAERALRHLALQERLVPLADGTHSGRGAALSAGPRPRARWGPDVVGAAASPPRAPGRGARLPHPGVHRRREQHRAGRLRFPRGDRR